MKTSLTLGIGDERARRPHPTGAELYAQKYCLCWIQLFQIDWTDSFNNAL